MAIVRTYPQNIFPLLAGIYGAEFLDFVSEDRLMKAPVEASTWLGLVISAGGGLLIFYANRFFSAYG